MNDFIVIGISLIKTSFGFSNSSSFVHKPLLKMMTKNKVKNKVTHL